VFGGFLALAFMLRQKWQVDAVKEQEDPERDAA
jgi:hypothetical protein